MNDTYTNTHFSFFIFHFSLKQPPISPINPEIVDDFIPKANRDVCALVGICPMLYAPSSPHLLIMFYLNIHNFLNFPGRVQATLVNSRTKRFQRFPAFSVLHILWPEGKRLALPGTYRVNSTLVTLQKDAVMVFIFRN